MDFEFSGDQVQLRDTVRKWVDKSYGFERRRQIVEQGGFCADAYREMAELGLCALYTGEADGGLAMSPDDAMAVMEELGSGIVLEPLMQTLITARLLERAGNAALKARYCAPLAAGEKRLALAQLERGSRYGLGNPETTAMRTCITAGPITGIQGPRAGACKHCPIRRLPSGPMQRCG
jgi:alkylation response protein AidB-like acyl-CoA dehydrogenase